jgi:hypothetical protein
MTPCAQIQLELFGLPGLAGPRSLFDGRSVAHLAGCVASSALSYCFQVFQVRPIGFDLFKDQSTKVQISSVPHLVTAPCVDVQSTTEDCSRADNFWPETDNA